MFFLLENTPDELIKPMSIAPKSLRRKAGLVQLATNTMIRLKRSNPAFVELVSNPAGRQVLFALCA